MKKEAKEILQVENWVEILKMINKYGSVEKRLLHSFFGNGDNPKVFFRRIARIEEFGYIKTNKRYCWISSDGEIELEKIGVSKNYTTVYSKRIKLAKEANQISMFPNRFILSRIEYLKNFQIVEDINYARMFSGVVWNSENYKELVYLFDDKTLKYIERYINLDLRVVDIDNIIITIDNINQLILMKKNIPSLKAKNVIVIPKGEEGILIYDLMKKGYINNKYLYKFLKEICDENEIKLDKENLFIDGMKVENFLGFDFRKLYIKTEKIKINNSKNTMFAHFNFYGNLFTETTPFFSDTSIEYGNLSINIYDYIEYLETNYGYAKCNFKSLGARLPFSNF